MVVLLKREFCALMVLNCCVIHARARVLSQEDVNRIVESELLMYEHDEDFQSAEKALMDGGVTKSMLAHGYYSSMLKTMNGGSGSLDSQKFQSAAYGFRGVATDGQLTNLLQIATFATNGLSAADAIEMYHSRCPLSCDLINWCTNEVVKGSCSGCVKSTIWSCFEKTMAIKGLPTGVRNKILTCAKVSLSRDPQTVFLADKLLVAHDHQYKISLMRRQVMARIAALRNVRMSDVVRRYFEDNSKEEGEQ